MAACLCLNSGYFCPRGTGTLSTALQCRSPTQYCPEGSSTPLNTSAGYYAVAALGGLYVNETECPPGAYCSGGVMQLCTAGLYGNSSGMTSANCSGVCEAGYYCPPGSTSPEAQSCGSVLVYCPAVRAVVAEVCGQRFCTLCAH